MPMRAVVAREQEALIAFSRLEVVAATPDGLVATSSLYTGYQQSAHYGNTAWAFLDLGETLWAFGPSVEERSFCPFSFTADAGIADGGPCSPAPFTLLGVANGGMWMRSAQAEPVRLYRPDGATLSPVQGVELPSLKWTGDGLPWATESDPSTMLVAHMEGDELSLDRYRGTAGFTWAGANEQWVWETDGVSTRVYSR